MSKFFYCLLIIVSSFSVEAQNTLLVHGASPSLHLMHTVAPKETWYAVGRLYNIGPKDIAAFNSLTIDKPLSIGQSVKIPLKDANFAQNDKKAADEVFVPVYHEVQDKEWMYRISVNHNKVPIESLEKWNNINRDQAKAGMNLVVGYLKVKKGQSALASGASSSVAVAKPAAPVTTPPATQEAPKATLPPATKDSQKPMQTQTATPPVVAETPAPAPSTSQGVANHKGGFFKKQYSESGKSAMGNAGVFRSTSGWSDGKYYALMNNVPVGTVVKISFSSSNKSIYAKVLGQLPEMRESTGLTLRLSDAAASELGAELTKFYVDVKY